MEENCPLIPVMLASKEVFLPCVSSEFPFAYKLDGTFFAAFIAPMQQPSIDS